MTGSVRGNHQIQIAEFDVLKKPSAGASSSQNADQLDGAKNQQVCETHYIEMVICSGQLRLKK
ncbi:MULTISPECIES: hypothetical protein [Pseudomonas]|uniref:Uncharacterized protein n=1 Tax=Pseudomonas tritici TaxID=2745518 RepID=A0A8H9Z3E3_9PSED|nr:MULTISPECIES: hypothetical protein [Pseudomonas]MBP2869959.1 hypothetical protein [Pseudomonas sp. SWRI144]QXH81289.1 hypothetical protein HU722_0014650 [Pseudomonas tritici]